MDPKEIDQKIIAKNKIISAKKPVQKIHRHLIISLSAIFLFTSIFAINTFAKDSTQFSHLIDLANKERSVNNLSNLKPNKALEKAAYAKALDMYNHQYFEHYSPQGRSPWQFIAEANYN